MDLIDLRIESGDERLKNHMETGNKNAKYTSWQIQNEIINFCGETIKNMVVEDVKKAAAYSIMADETGDVAGKEQLSVGVRFFDQKNMIIREEFLGYVELQAQDAKTISTTIEKFIEKCNFDPNKCVGQGYDGCPTMSGFATGVQKRLQEIFPSALYFHCASHRLNLTVNDLNAVPEVRNTIATIKNIINFFRESPQRRARAPNVSKLCETRWSEKHKSVGDFKKHFVELVNALQTLSEEGNNETKPVAFQLHAAATNSVFIICVCIISKYSALLEPVVNILQSKSLDLFKCAEHIKRICSTIEEHRSDAENTMKAILKDAEAIAAKLEIDLKLPRTAARQQNRPNPPFSQPDEYWRRSLLIPYLDSLSTSLTERFPDNNSPAYSLLSFHPSNMLQKSIEELKATCHDVANFYKLENLEHEIEVWYNVWKTKNLNEDYLKSLDLIDVFEEANELFPSMKLALEIAMALPCTTATGTIIQHLTKSEDLASINDGRGPPQW